MLVRVVLRKEVEDVDKGQDFLDIIKEQLVDQEPYEVEARVSTIIPIDGD